MFVIQWRGNQSRRFLGIRRTVVDKNQLHGNSQRSFCLCRESWACLCREFKGWIGCLWILGLRLGLLSWHDVFPTSPPFWPFFSENTAAHLILAGISDSTDMNLRKLQERVKDREAWHAAVHGVVKTGTWLSDWTATDFLTPKKIGSHLKISITVFQKSLFRYCLNRKG